MKKSFTLHGMALALLLLLGALHGTNALAQTDSLCNTRPTYLYWVGGSSNNFFDEMNWRVARQVYITKKNNPGGLPICKPGAQPKFIICLGSHNPAVDKAPKKGTLDPGKPIPFNLYVENTSLTLDSSLVFSCIDKGITLSGAKLQVNASLKGTAHLDKGSTLRMAGTTLENNLRISLQDPDSWVYFDEINPVNIAALPLSTWMTGLVVPSSLSSLVLNQYYQKGTLVRMDVTNYKPLTIYGSQHFGGGSSLVGLDSIYAGASIPAGLDNNIRSFRLKRGFMATLANNANGTGKSQVFIASEKDLEVDVLPASLSGNVSFIRVLPWNWVTKKGTGGLFEGNPLDAGWFYSWSSSLETRTNYEYVPMTWGAGTTNPAGIQALVDKNSVTHLLGFNESDNCSDQSGQYLNLCQPEVAVAYYERLMASGLRLGTPAPRENGPTTWLREFAAIAKQRDVRFDFVAVHWYDWGSNPASSPYADAQQVFNRFKAYLLQVYNEYHLPIWITEFNANPNRDNSVQAAFLQLALPYLESLPYVERYAYFQPNPAYGSTSVNPANYFDAGGNLTNIGLIYKGHTSSSSMPDSTYSCTNNLNGMDQPLPVKQQQQYVFEAECGKFPGSKWTVGEIEAASNGKYLQGNPSLTGATQQATQVHFDFNVTEENNFRIWLRTKATNGQMVVQVNHDKFDTIRSVNTSDFVWQSVPRLYSFKTGQNRVSLAFVNNLTQFDQVAIVAGSEDVNSPVLPAGNCEPAPAIWGQTAPSPIFAEAETATKGASWSNGSNDKAIGGLFVQCGNLTSPATAPTADGWLTFSLDVTTAGAYQFWAKMQSLETTSNKLWLKIDNGDFSPWNDLTQANFLWKWMRYDPARDGGARQEFLFLEPGTHTFTIAYASGGIKIDRVALMPAANSPAAIDPDVVIPQGPQSFEAEEAVLLGTAAIAPACTTASNGLVVNPGNLSTNGMQFNKVLAGSAGTYQLTIRYFVGGTLPRNQRVFVNGTLLPTQRMVVTGPWCYEGGSPGTWTMSIRLNPGENVIELRPVSAQNAPLVDKIEVRPALVSLEAELAQLSGSNTLVTCTSASNSGLVNMGAVAGNSVQFNNISIPTTGTYNLNVSYITQVSRIMRMFIDGEPSTSVSFAASGEWCYNSGVPVVKTIPVNLTQGLHSIRFQPPTAGEAPFLDKIDLVDPSNPAPAPVTTVAPQREEGVALLMSQPVPSASGLVYPNPARAGSTIYLPAENSKDSKAATITLLDIRGSAVKTSVQSAKTGFSLPQVTAGIYLVRVNESGTVKTYRLMIQ